jgi:hypothetical protein
MRSPALALCALPLSFLTAQGQDIFITNANVSFGVEFNATPFVYVATQDFFRADPAGDPLGLLFKTAWAYRLNADTREFIFNDGGGQAVFSNNGPVGTATWANVDGRGLISANAFYVALPTGANSGVVLCRMSISNISTSPVTLNLFHLADIDLCGAAYSSNIMTPGANGHQNVTGSCTETADHFAAGADRWEVGSYTGLPAGNVDLYTRFEDTALYNLANTAAPVGPFDMRGAYQWQDRVLQPGQTETYTITLAHETTGQAFGFDHYGSGRAGSLGVPQLTSAGDALLGTTMTPTVGNCPPGALVVLVLGFNRAQTTIGDLTMWIGAPSSNFVLVANGSGSVGLPIAIPNNPAFIGINLFGEGFVFDATTTSTSGFPLTHTTGAQWVLGVY